MAQFGHRRTTRGMTRSRAMSVLVLTAAGLSCLGQKPAGTPPGSAAGKEPAPLEPIRLDGTCFTRGGRRFISVGVNWVPAVKAMQWPYQWDPVSIEHDFASMHELGINTVRLDLVWAWFEPRPGDYNPKPSGNCISCCRWPIATRSICNHNCSSVAKWETSRGAPSTAANHIS